MIQLRDYQQRSIDMLYDWMRDNEGHPCLVLPTGAGKSHVVAALCRDAVQTWPETRILMLTHVKELIEQNAEKMLQHWPGAPLGIYSASIGPKNLGESITFAGIQSIRGKASEIGHVDLVIIDECHLVNHKNEGGYRELIGQLTGINDRLRVIGLTATPWRLGHGLITEEPAIFSELIEPISIVDLVKVGHLSLLRSKLTDHQIDVSGVKKRGGEYIEKDLAEAVDTDDSNAAAVDEVIRRAGDRRAWLFFCVGVAHAERIRDRLRDRGITAECVTGSTPKRMRERILSEFKAGKVRAMTNANVLTTGFDYPDIDLIALLRPTESPTLYVQMAGRGLRPKSHTDHCMVLDFAGLVRRHGPITNVQPPDKAGEGDAPVKTCPECDELVPIAQMECPGCGHQFPEPEDDPAGFGAAPKPDTESDIMGIEPEVMEVRRWEWSRHVSARSGKEMIRVRYYGTRLLSPAVDEYLAVAHGGRAQEVATSKVMRMARKSGVQITWPASIPEIVQAMNKSTPPSKIMYRMERKWYSVKDRIWNEHQQLNAPRTASRWADHDGADAARRAIT